jgi:hypothetical protein
MLNGRPRKIKTGSCNKPAPPPANAEKALAISDTIKSRIYSVIG